MESTTAISIGINLELKRLVDEGKFLNMIEVLEHFDSNEEFKRTIMNRVVG